MSTLCVQHSDSRPEVAMKNSTLLATSIHRPVRRILEACLANTRSGFYAALILFFAPAFALSQDLAGAQTSVGTGWPQWAQNSQHTGMVQVTGQLPKQALAQIVYDPFVAQEQAEQFGDLVVHYQAPLIDGNNVYMEFKTGKWIKCKPTGSWYGNINNLCGPNAWNQEIWNEEELIWVNGKLKMNWTFQTDWKPEPNGNGFHLVGWEPVFHPVLAGSFIYVPGFGGTIYKVDKRTGQRLSRINPFGSIDPNTYVSGPLTADSAGNIYYNVMKLADPATGTDPWFDSDVLGAWLVKVTPQDVASSVSYATLVPGAPAGNGGCPGWFTDSSTLPWPPSPTAVPGQFLCGSQRPGLNVAPAIAPDGTIYTLSVAHYDRLVSYLVAVNPDLTPKWQASLQRLLNDGCGVLIPIATADNPNQPNACRVGTTVGVDPRTNDLGSGEVHDEASSTPTVLPDGAVLVPTVTFYPAVRGHLMKFSATGTYLASYDFGWDTTPAVYPHDGTYSIVLKDNHYDTGMYCRDSSNPICASLPPGPYYITSLDANLNIQWQFQNTNHDSCFINQRGFLQCQLNTNPNGFEWCINAPAIDAAGNVYANSEDGNLYVIDKNGNLVKNLFLNLAIGAAYTPLSIGPDGKIYTQNDGQLFVVGSQ
jgi:hypothetical protein